MCQSILARFFLTLFLSVLPPLLADIILTASWADAAEGGSNKDIDSLIADLRGNTFETREKATRALKERVEAIPVLRKERHTDDLEVRRRVLEILTALDRKRALRGLAKVNELAKAGRIVEAADRLAFAAKCGIPAEERWSSLTQFAAQVIARTEGYFPLGWKFDAKPNTFPVGDFRRFAQLTNPKEIAQAKIEICVGRENDKLRDEKVRAGFKLMRAARGALLLRGEEVSLTANPHFPLNGGMIAASGNVQLSGAAWSLVIAGGDVTELATARECILICDGDLEFVTGRGIAHTSIVVARGKVVYNPEEFTFTNCLIRSGHSLLLPDAQKVNVGKRVELKDGTPDPLGFVRFFELTDVGLVAEDLPAHAKSDSRRVQLKEVRKESPFAAGLRVGDVITAIDEKKTPTTEAFRKTLRRTLAEGGPLINFTVQRAGKTLEVPVSVKD